MEHDFSVPILKPDICIFFKITMPCMWINSVLLFLKAFPSTYWFSIIRAQLSGVRKKSP